MTLEDAVVDVSQDWVHACDVQQRFMQGPALGAGPLDYAARCRQLKALGGDWYDFIPLAGDRLALAVGDASGKGLAAALTMASVQSSLRTAAWFTPTDLAALLKVVNVQAYASSSADRYATLFYGLLDPAARTLRYVNAGHNPPIIVREGGSVHRLEPTGALLECSPIPAMRRASSGSLPAICSSPTPMEWWKRRIPRAKNGAFPAS